MRVSSIQLTLLVQSRKLLALLQPHHVLLLSQLHLKLYARKTSRLVDNLFEGVVDTMLLYGLQDVLNLVDCNHDQIV